MSRNSVDACFRGGILEQYIASCVCVYRWLLLYSAAARASWDPLLLRSIRPLHHPSPFPAFTFRLLVFYLCYHGNSPVVGVLDRIECSIRNLSRPIRQLPIVLLDLVPLYVVYRLVTIIRRLLAKRSILRR